MSRKATLSSTESYLSGLCTATAIPAIVMHHSHCVSASRCLGNDQEQGWGTNLKTTGGGEVKYNFNHIQEKT